MNIHSTKIEGVQIIRPQVYGDERGFFVENFEKERYKEVTGQNLDFVQDNVSQSKKGVLRGLHFQKEPHAQGKLVSVLSGRVFDVAVDIRKDSLTFGKYESIELVPPYRDKDGQWQWTQFYIAPGLAHGFLTLEDDTLFAYKCTDVYAPESDGGIMWNDPGIGIQWPELDVEIVVSEKDKKHPQLKELRIER